MAQLEDVDAILVPGGFGERGTEGKVDAIRWARQRKIPFFGICLGMQCAVVEYALNVLKLECPASTEVDPETKNPVIDLMLGQKKITQKGGTMRLGAYGCELKKKSISFQAYQSVSISERHRHRYEFNNKYLELFEKSDLQPIGFHPELNLVEIVELKNHPWFVGVQFHPELKSTVENPHPLFVSFIQACLIHERKA
jgi:CTP synthase